MLRLLGTVLLAGFMPRRVCAWHAQTKLVHALALHMVGIGIIVLLILGLFEISGFLDAFDPYSSSPGYSPTVTLPALMLYLFVGELLGLAAGLVWAVTLVAWCWQDEPLRDTWRHALRASWIGTTFLPGPVLLAGGSTILAESGLVSGDRSDLMGFSGLVIASGWALATFLRAATAPRPARAVVHEPLCEQCGYVLLHLSSGARCPECGEPAALSLDPDKRRLAPWSRSSYAVFIPHALACLRRAWFDARTFFTHLQLRGGIGHALGCAFLATAGTAGSVWLLFILLISAEESYFDLEDAAIILEICMLITEWCLAAWLLVISLVGLVASHKYGRNLLGAVALVGGYTSGYFIPWALLLIAITYAVIGFVEHAGTTPPFMLIGFGLLGLNALLFFGYLWGVWLRIRYVAYGNWGLADAPPVNFAAANSAAPGLAPSDPAASAPAASDPTAPTHSNNT